MRYDKFESLSLPLPSGMGDLGWGRHKLHQLLSNFTTAEVVNDVSCEGCNRGRDPTLPPIQSKQMKIQQFGKVYVLISLIICLLNCNVIFISFQYVCVFTFQETYGTPRAKCPNGKITSSFLFVCH